MFRYETLAADGETFVELNPAGLCALHWLKVADEAEAEVYGLAIGTYAPVEINALPGAIAGYDADLLARFRITATEVADPPAPRAQLPKSTVTARVSALGKAGDVWALFNANPDLAFQWLSPDWPNVYCDDAGLLAALQAIGLTPTEIAAVTAA